MNRRTKGLPPVSRRRLAAALLSCAAFAASSGIGTNRTFAQSAEPSWVTRAASTTPAASALSSLDDDEDASSTTASASTSAATSAKTRAAQEAVDPLQTSATELDGRVSGVNDDPAAADFARLNTRETGVDGLRSRTDPFADSTPGIRLGTFVLRPSVTQSVAGESSRSGSDKQSRSYLETAIKGTLTSDWSRHELSVVGDGVFQRNLSGELETEPQANIDGTLRLDLADDTIANVTAGYGFSREGTDDPNAIDGADVQSGVNTFLGGVAVTRDFGILRGTAAINGTRSLYSDARLLDGTKVSMSDRDRYSGGLRGRIGYEISPALIPFVEASIGRTIYDEARDRDGYERNSRNYAGRAGLELDLGEKLKGELGLGYERVTFADQRLAAIGAVSVDGSATWSPQRGTDVTLGLSTSVEPSTTAGQSGYVSYALNGGISQEVRDNVVARLSTAATWRTYDAKAQNETVYAAGTGLTWGITRSLELTGDLDYELTARETGSDTRVLRAGIGLTLRR